MTEQPEKASAGGSVQYLNPDDLLMNPAYTNVVAVSGSVKTIYIGAQGAFDASTRTIVGKGDIGAQSMQAMKTSRLRWRLQGPIWSILSNGIST